MSQSDIAGVGAGRPGQTAWAGKGITSDGPPTLEDLYLAQQQDLTAELQAQIDELKHALERYEMLRRSLARPHAGRETQSQTFPIAGGPTLNRARTEDRTVAGWSAYLRS
ncbi:MAG: hypothetical protein AB1758_09060 [Candidatus Eremiobacterota bacterium]